MGLGVINYTIVRYWSDCDILKILLHIELEVELEVIGWN